MLKHIRERWQDSEYLPRIIVEVGGLLLALPAALVWAFGSVGVLLVAALFLFLVGALVAEAGNQLNR